MRIFLLFTFCIINACCFAQCGYYYLQNNKTVTIGMFDRKGNADGKYVYKVSGVSKNGSVTSATVQSEVFDKKGKSMGSGKGVMQCKNGVLMIDMRMLLSPQQMEQFKNAKVEGKSTYMEYPASLSAGQVLQDGSFNMDVKMENGITATVSIDVTNRKVEAKEKVTTSAGTWDAYKITYDAKTVITMGIGIPIKMQLTEWFVPDFGMVKSSSKWGTQELVSIE
ncbi:TapB family protein [Niabella aquatica]